MTGSSVDERGNVRKVKVAGASPGNLFASCLGVFLGLAIIKFGNPVILGSAVPAPTGWVEAWSFPWPPQWAFWGLPLVVLTGVCLAAVKRGRWNPPAWLWIAPLAWLLWQCAAACAAADPVLPRFAIAQFSGCVACYLLGGIVLNSRRLLFWMLAGLLAGFAFCLVRAVDQRAFEFPREERLLKSGQESGWTNFPPDLVVRLKSEGVIVHTNGVDVANPFIMAKYAKRRVQGTMVYPNALAGVILLLWPVSVAAVMSGTRQFHLVTRVAAVGMTVALGGLALFWTGSKLGWLIVIALLALALFCLKFLARWRYPAIAGLLIIGLTVFAVRFQRYFTSGATSAWSRLDYWRAAVQVTVAHPWLGTGPGTFGTAYARVKLPESEMARLAHNDYLEQFCDSGIIGGAIYLAWIGVALIWMGRCCWGAEDRIAWAVCFGVWGWFAQGFAEFGLYIPASAWTAFVLLGWAVNLQQEDRPS